MVARRRTSGAVLLLSLALLLPLSGCGAVAGAMRVHQEPPDPVGPDGPSVVASFYPLAYLAQRITGDHARVHNLTTPGAEPHDIELTVRQTAQVADADVVVYESGFQPAVDTAVEQNPAPYVVDTVDSVPLRDHGDGPDPHVWLDPENMERIARAVSSALAADDPDRRRDYARNTRRLLTDLRRLDREYAAGLSQCRTDTVVVAHDAFGYLARYGPDFLPVTGLSPDLEPSPAHVARLHESLEHSPVTTVFTGPLASPRLTDALAGDLGMRTAVLDPIEGLTEDTAGEDYLSLMRRNLTALREANRCR